MPESLTETQRSNTQWLNGRLNSFNQDEVRKDTILPLLPQHFAEMETQKKIAEYQNYEMRGVEQFWFMNTETRKITHMADKRPGCRHGDLKDGKLRRTFKYPITVFYYLQLPAMTDKP